MTRTVLGALEKYIIKIQEKYSLSSIIMENQYEIVMGLETHVRIKSETKMFCACRNAVELADEPNLHTCPYCMAFPWALPVLNERVIDLAVRAGQAMRCTVNETSIFDRKSYFYPDNVVGTPATDALWIPDYSALSSDCSTRSGSCACLRRSEEFQNRKNAYRGWRWKVDPLRK